MTTTITFVHTFVCLDSLGELNVCAVVLHTMYDMHVDLKVPCFFFSFFSFVCSY